MAQGWRWRWRAGAVVGLVAAIALAGCGPSIDAAAKADLDRRVAGLAPAGQSYGPPAGPTPMAMAVGQWVTYKITDDKQQPALMTLKLVGQDGQAFWYETVSESYYGKSATRMLVDFGDRAKPESIVIKAAKIRDAKGNVTDYPPAMVDMLNSVLRGQLGPIVIDWRGLAQEDTTTLAGHFSACYKGQSQTSWGGLKSTGTGWGHTSVPLSGMVRFESDNQSKGELVSFGTSGAKSEF